MLICAADQFAKRHDRADLARSKIEDDITSAASHILKPCWMKSNIAREHEWMSLHHFCCDLALTTSSLDTLEESGSTWHNTFHDNLGYFTQYESTKEWWMCQLTFPVLSNRIYTVVGDHCWHIGIKKPDWSLPKLTWWNQNRAFWILFTEN